MRTPLQLVASSKATSPPYTAVQLWVALHGYVTLRARAPDFP
jgi:hypothetical protein